MIALRTKGGVYLLVISVVNKCSVCFACVVRVHFVVVSAQAVQLTPVPILKRGADEERSETARLVSDVAGQGSVSM